MSSSEESPRPLAVDIWSDIACPWCWIGKRHLEAALEAFEHADAVNVTWHAFELDPSAPRKPEEGVDYVERLARKYRTNREGAQGMIDRMTSTAASDGLTMRFDHIQPGNTFDAHRLIRLAKEVGKQDAMKERLFAAYLEEGEAIGDVDTLAKLGEEVGLDPARVKAVLDSEELAEEVRADESAAREMGVSGVPFFVIDNHLAFSGAQPADVIVTVLEKAWNERSD